MRALAAGLLISMSLGCAQHAQDLPSLSELPTLNGTEVCDGQSGDGTTIVCRRFEVGRVDAIFEYQIALGDLGWRPVYAGQDVLAFPVGPNGTLPLWFERPIDARCSEVLSVVVRPQEARGRSDRMIALFFVPQANSVCGNQRLAS